MAANGDSGISSVIETIISNAQSVTGGVFVLSSLMVVGFIVLASRLNKDSPFAPYALQFLGILIVMPGLMFLGVTKTIDSNAVSAAVGAMVAYIFTSRASTKPDS